jgi:methylmalonyl-CoA/ethylmalonyl-CoA epimerase
MKISDLIVKVRHIGVIVDDVKASTELYRKLYDVEEGDVRVVPPWDVADAETRFTFVPVGGMEFELIEPISDTFKNFIGNPAKGINHIAFIVTDLNKAVELMKEKGVRLGHVTRDGILDMKRSRVAYFNPEDTGGVLLEFVEPVAD